MRLITPTPCWICTAIVIFRTGRRPTGVDDFGLRFGRDYRLEDMGPLGQLVLNSPCLGVALASLCKNFAAVQEHSDLMLRSDGSLLHLEYQIRDGRIANRRHDAELSIGIFNNIFRRALGPNWAPEEIHFEHLRAAEPLAHQNLLNAPCISPRPATPSCSGAIFCAARCRTPTPACSRL